MRVSTYLLTDCRNALVLLGGLCLSQCGTAKSEPTVTESPAQAEPDGTSTIGSVRLGPAIRIGALEPNDPEADSAGAGGSDTRGEANDPGAGGGGGASGKANQSGADHAGSGGLPAEVKPGPTCGAVLTGIVRDFKGVDEPGGHPDFEAYSGSSPSIGIVSATLGSDRKPVYSGVGPFIDSSVNGDGANGQQTTDKAHFDQWYRNTAGVNLPFIVYLASGTNAGLRTFQSEAFFPLDGAGFGNTPGQMHNFGFTTEVHAAFVYKPGQTFAFTGDDDLWVFVNSKLVIDLGGLHAPAPSFVSLDERQKELGLEVGRSYPLDLFHAERHSTQSNFKMETNLEFNDCAILVPESSGAK